MPEELWARTALRMGPDAAFLQRGDSLEPPSDNIISHAPGSPSLSRTLLHLAPQVVTPVTGPHITTSVWIAGAGAQHKTRDDQDILTPTPMDALACCLGAGESSADAAHKALQTKQTTTSSAKCNDSARPRKRSLLATANSRRTVAATLMNERSYGSCSVFTLRIRGTARTRARHARARSRALNLVDLASSERLNVSGAGKDKERLWELECAGRRHCRAGREERQERQAHWHTVPEFEGGQHMAPMWAVHALG
ncbi:hypothetical protein BC826DRAFT_970823 [Russula brevipes]|nr:hypothetical protein BC826DRAFT_970823 [Russula brevipes]